MRFKETTIQITQSKFIWRHYFSLDYRFSCCICPQSVKDCATVFWGCCQTLQRQPSASRGLQEVRGELRNLTIWRLCIDDQWISKLVNTLLLAHKRQLVNRSTKCIGLELYLGIWILPLLTSWTSRRARAGWLSLSPSSTPLTRSSISDRTAWQLWSPRK